MHFVRGWQGHTIEQRWFSVFNESFRILVATANDYTESKFNQRAIEFVLDEKRLDILHVHADYIIAIQSLEE